MGILTKFDEDWTKIVNFQLVVYIFLGQCNFLLLGLYFTAVTYKTWLVFPKQFFISLGGFMVFLIKSWLHSGESLSQVFINNADNLFA